MDAVDVVVLLLRIALVALLYLFLAAVMRSMLRVLRTPDGSAPSARPASRASSSASRLRLMVLEAANSSLGVGDVLEAADGAVLGRAGRADVVLADPTVSSEHARLSRVGRAWVVTDLGSTNGTRVNGARVDGETPLAAGDVLALGGVELQVAAP